MDKQLEKLSENIKEIYLAGGCFWGVEAFMGRLYGVVEAHSGYANGKTHNPKYEDLLYNDSGHAETVLVRYDANQIKLKTLLKYYFRIIDPTSLNRQGGDKGVQYRSGIYYVDASDLPVIEGLIQQIARDYKNPIVVEVKPLEHFYLAEEYHQRYLIKNPTGYCHINLAMANEVIVEEEDYVKPPLDALQQVLTPLQFDVTQKSHTERPFSNEFWETQAPGLYVDIVTGEPLFTSKDKFNSNCGWPSFAQPITEEVVAYKTDTTHGMKRTEVRSRVGDSHLGHIFDDGPKELGGMRYCINSASLRFIPLEEMEIAGYGAYIYKVKG